ncbi:MAG: PTPDL family protein [Akkermansiaceae bacterium]
MKFHFPFVTICLLATSLPCPADTFTLKDGNILEGKILREDGDSYVIEIQITRTIKDERSVAKADILKIEHEQLDLTAFEEIGKLVPTPDLLGKNDYRQQIAQVGQFLKTYPESIKVGQAEEIQETLKSEEARIEAGGIKVNGEILSPSAYKANAYELDARVQEATIRGLIAREEMLAALRAFAEFEREYRATLPYGTLAPLMRRLVSLQVEKAKQQLMTLEDRLITRQIGLDRMTVEDRPVTKRAIHDEAQAIEARFKAEKDAKINWVSTSPFHKNSLEETVRFGSSELARLAAVPPVRGDDGGRAYRDAWRAIHGTTDPAAVSAALAAARAASIAPRYITLLEELAKKN